MKIKIAFLNGFTISGLKEAMVEACKVIGVEADIYEGEYQQYAQEILNEHSGLYQFKPDLTFLIVDTRSLFKNRYYDFDMSWSSVFDEFRPLIDGFLSRTTHGKLIIFTPAAPTFDSYGVVGSKSYRLNEKFHIFNSLLCDTYKDEPRVFFYDFGCFLRKHGEDIVFEPRLYFYGDFHINPAVYPFLCQELLSYIYPALSMSRKCIVLDLDGTLWGGIIGEDGMDGIQLGPSPPGNAYVELQRYLLMLYKRGILLAINSKNNEDDALRVLREHPYMVLKEEHFSAMRINWNDKAQNLRELAQELNIGLDSLVFIDDDPVNRQLIRDQLPMVAVVDLPSDPSYYSHALTELQCFSTFQITEDDRKRGELYAQERKRKGASSSFTDLTSYLKNLEIKIKIVKYQESLVPRISQLTMKTNQFNLTTPRYSEEVIRAMHAEGAQIFAVQASDRYGDYGIIGVVIIKRQFGNRIWVIDTFLLSCRVIGRGIEKSILQYIITKAKDNGVIIIQGQYVDSGKNSVCASMYPDNGFILDDAKYYYEYFTNEPFPPVEHIEVKNP